MSEAAAVGGFARLLSDDRLARRAVEGDQQAFAAIFRRYHQSLYRFCLALVGNPEDAQDALQNTMVKVLRALPGEERKIELKPWLYRIAHNESIDLLRRRRETRSLDPEQPAPGRGLAEDAATRERLRRLIADMEELPERQRGVLVMRELAGLDFEQIASALGTSGGVARQTLYEARQSLRQMEEGREMSCEAVSLALSDGDGRVIRRRDVRAHLRSCSSCRAFRDQIDSREHDLAALAPLPALAAAGMLHGLIGGGQAAGGGSLATALGGGAAKSVGISGGGSLATALGGGAAKSVGISAAAKGVATAAVVAAIGVTAADRTGVIHLGLPGDRPAKSSGTDSSGAGGSPAATGGVGAAGVAPVGSPVTSRIRADGHRLGAAKGHHDAAAGKGNGKALAPGSGSQGSHGSHGLEGQLQSQAHDPVVDHPSGRGNEQQHPEAAATGQEKAVEGKPSGEPSGGKSGAEGEAGEPTTPSGPDAPPGTDPPGEGGSVAPPAKPEAGSQGAGARPESVPPPRGGGGNPDGAG
jgi:RNA polymerase sigma factor (sigma-70 family)